MSSFGMKVLFVYLLVVHVAILVAQAQGCSDSGFCTMGALRPDQPFSARTKIKLHSIEITQHLGTTKYGDWIHASFVDANFIVGKRNSFQLRAPAYMVIEGNMPTVRGWGDTYLSLTRQLYLNDYFQLNATLGGKIYTTATSIDNAMPMYQQTTQGSNDLMIGVSLISKKWMIAVGYQRPLNATRNTFHPQQFVATELEEAAGRYAPSVGLLRGDDMALRIEKNFRLARWNFFVGTLNLFRSTPDQILDSEGKLQTVNGSQGLSSNLLTGVGYQFNVQSGIRLLMAGKLTERAQSPDGLSRDFVAQLAYVVRF
ncbi:MAG: hypothetical protein ACKODM_06050 [Cytophagales bacterium]